MTSVGTFVSMPDIKNSDHFSARTFIHLGLVIWATKLSKHARIQGVRKMNPRAVRPTRDGVSRTHRQDETTCSVSVLNPCDQIRTLYSSTFVLAGPGGISSWFLPILRIFALLLLPILCLVVLHWIVGAVVEAVCNVVRTTANCIATIMINFIKYTFLMLILTWVLRLVLPEQGPLAGLLHRLSARIRTVLLGNIPVKQTSNYCPKQESSSFAISNVNDEGLSCVVCLSDPKCVILLPCRHLCLCSTCSELIVQETNTCPLCRTRIAQSVQVFM